MSRRAGGAAAGLLRRRGGLAAVAAASALLLAGCLEDADPIRPDPGAGGALLERYVSLGNSITAGFQSGGINAGTQAEAYPALIAAQAGAVFGTPDLLYPGCPPPLEQVLPPRRVGGFSGGFCLLRAVPPDRPIQNVAVPGAKLADALDNLIPGSSANALTTLILGGRTQVEAMVAARPTLVSAWLGSNELLGAALSGEAAAATPLPVFQAGLDSLAAAIAATAALDAILIGVPDVTLVPALQPAAFLWLVRDLLEAFGITVAADCAPGAAGAGSLVSLSLLFDASARTVSCAADSPYVLSAAEAAALNARSRAFNAAIREAAEERGWIYYDPNPRLAALLADPDLLRKCQGLATADTPAEVAAAVLQTCPNPDAPNFFGRAFSLDGVHPSGYAHRLLANDLIGLLNAKHDLEIPTIVDF